MRRTDSSGVHAHVSSALPASLLYAHGDALFRTELVIACASVPIPMHALHCVIDLLQAALPPACGAWSTYVQAPRSQLQLAGGLKGIAGTSGAHQASHATEHAQQPLTTHGGALQGPSMCRSPQRPRPAARGA